MVMSNAIRMGLLPLCLLAGCARPTTPSVAAPTTPIVTSPPHLVPVKPDSGVVTVSHQTSDVDPKGKRLRLTVTFVEFQSSPQVDAFLDRLWGEPAPGAPASTTAVKSTVMAREEIQKSLNALQNQGLARIVPEQSRQVVDAQPDIWSAPVIPAEVDIVLTPTVRSDDVVRLAFKGQPATNARQVTIGTDEVTAEVSNNQVFVVAGPITTGTAVEISRLPFVGELPVVGPMYFSKRKIRTEVHKSLFLISAKVPDEAQEQSATQVPE